MIVCMPVFLACDFARSLVCLQAGYVRPLAALRICATQIQDASNKDKKCKIPKRLVPSIASRLHIML